MTLCIGLVVGDAVILAADSRRTIMPSGEYRDDFQKVMRITDNLWTTGAGNSALSTYIQNLLSEFAPNNVEAYLQLLQPIILPVFRLQKTIYTDPRVTQAGYELMVALLVGGYNQATDKMCLFGFSSADDFMPSALLGGIIGGTAHDQVLAQTVMASVGASEPETAAEACKQAICAVSQTNREIGPHGHVVVIGRRGHKLIEF